MRQMQGGAGGAGGRGALLLEKARQEC
jgi:hypothetical protein